MRIRNIQEINRQLKEIAKEKGIVYIDLYSSFVTPENKLNPEYSIDGLHLNISGYRLWERLLLASRFSGAAMLVKYRSHYSLIGTDPIGYRLEFFFTYICLVHSSHRYLVINHRNGGHHSANVEILDRLQSFYETIAG